MPQIILKGVEKEKIFKIKDKLIEELSEISNTPKDYFIIEIVDSTFLMYNQDMYALINIIQYKREKEVEEKMMSIVFENLRSIGYEEIEGYYTHIDKENYYM